MEKETLKHEMLQLITEEIDLWLAAQGTIKDGYEYEERFMGTAQNISKILLTKSMGKLPGSRNKKNSIPVLER